MIKQPQVFVFLGHFGSGKSETAINFALNAARQPEKTVLIDLDIVNPFFRSSEVAILLEERGIELIAPNFARSTVDVPSLPASIQGVFYREGGTVIFDVGGDPEGATALGRYKQYFDAIPCNIYFVINTRRPFTSSADEIIEIMGQIEQHARQKITHLVSNTNLSFETTVDIIEEGIVIVEEVSRRTGLPIAMINVPKNLEHQFPKKYEELSFSLQLYMQQWRN